MKYVPSALIGQLSKSQGSTTASHNRFGSYFRNRVVPVNPQTAKQTTQRNDLQELSQQYRQLTEAQRLGWAALGLNMVRLDSQGQAYTLTGLQAYTSINRNRRLLGLADSSSAPAIGSITALTTITLTATSV